MPGDYRDIMGNACFVQDLRILAAITFSNELTQGIDVQASDVLDKLLNDSLESLTLPDIYLRLREVMDSDEASMEDVAQVLTLDPALAARILRIANSAMYGLRSQVDTVTRAANMLGMQKIHDLVLAVSLSKTVGGLKNPVMDMHTFWYRSVHCGFLAKSLAEGAGLCHSESMFVRALLHDIGHLLLFNHFPEASRRAIAHSDKGLSARMLAEQEMIGIDAISLAAELVKAWGLPANFTESFHYLLAPQDARAAMIKEIAMLHIAVEISNGLDSDLLLDQVIAQVPRQIWVLAELPPEVGTAALEASSLEMIDAMYQIIVDAD